MGTPLLWTFAAPRWSGGQIGGIPARRAAGRRDGGHLVTDDARGLIARPPAVAVIGLRRGGRTGNGESPRGRTADRLPDRATPLTLDTGTRAASRTIRAARRTARSACP
jgi:hypothetical protein